MPSVFIEKLKASYDHVADGYKIHPEVLGTTRADFHESIYQAFKKNFNMRTRIKFFELNENELTFSFGTFSLIMYYAKQVDYDNGKKMLDATLSEYYFRVNYDLPEGDLTDSDEQAHFVVADIQQVTGFIQNQLIPSLNAESMNLLEKYGGRDNFYHLFYKNMDFLQAIGIDNNEYYDDDPDDLVTYLGQFKDFLQYALSINQVYTVYVN